MTTRRNEGGRAGLLALALMALPVAEAIASTPQACAQLTQLTLPDSDMKIEKAEWVPAGKLPPGPFGPAYEGVVPAHCRADGVLEARTGRNGRPYAIGFAIVLPEQWNGRFMFQGGGGLNGTVNPPLGTQATGDTPALARGFAVVSTDSGHKGAVFDASFFEDQQAALNFLYQSVGKVTVVAKRIIEHHYGKGAERSYFVGCSTGGREAMILSQRYPDYFDGIVAGAPAMRTSYSNLALRWIVSSFNAAAPKGANGNPDATQAFSDGDRKLIVEAFLRACDAKDGIEDRMVFNTRACGFDPEVLVCKGEKTSNCLTAQQVSALKKAMAGPKDSKGRQVYPGFLYDTGIADAPKPTMPIPGLLWGSAGPVAATPSAADMNVDEEAAAAASAISILGDTNSWTNLGTFADRGGKLIFYHGVSDPWFSALDTVQYYERLVADNGGASAVSDWSRLFLVPGMGHCGGGESALDRFDMLSAVVDWVEQRKAPGSITATGMAFPGRSRPLCPYPKYAHYKGRGNPDAADSYECRE